MSLKSSVSQVSPQVLSLLVLHPNIPDEPPKARLLVASLGCVAQACCLGGFSARLRARTWEEGISIRVHSQRDVVPRPTGSLTARVLGNGGLALPRVSTRGFEVPGASLSSLRPLSVITWDCASRFSPARLSRAPRSGCDSPPRPLLCVSPCQT